MNKISSGFIFCQIISVLSFALWGCGNISIQETSEALTEESVQSVSIQEESVQVVTDETNNELPWGFDERSYQMYTNGELDQYIPVGSELDQCVTADLNLDGIQDLLMSVTIPDSLIPDGTCDAPLNTLILKGLGGNTYELAAENAEINFYSSYDGTAQISAQDGWLKFSRSRGTAGGYVYDYLFEYDKDSKDWVLSSYYYNNYGYIEQGESQFQTPENYGRITFSEFDGSLGWENQIAEKEKWDTSLSVNSKEFVVTVSGCYVFLQDKEKEREVNNLIAAETQKMIESLKNLNVTTHLNLSGNSTYETPDIISIEYTISGTMGGEESIYSGINGKYFTLMIDLKSVRKITLSDIMEADKLYEIIQTYEREEGQRSDSDTTENRLINNSKEQYMELLRSSDHFQKDLDTGNGGIFSAVYEKSLCIYIQPDFFSIEPNAEDCKYYISLEDILPYVKRDYWNIPSYAATHIEWRG